MQNKKLLFCDPFLLKINLQSTENNIKINNQYFGGNLLKKAFK